MENEFPMHNLEIARYSLQRIRLSMIHVSKDSERMEELRRASRALLEKWPTLRYR